MTMATKADRHFRPIAEDALSVHSDFNNYEKQAVGHFTPSESSREESKGATPSLVPSSSMKVTIFTRNQEAVLPGQESTGSVINQPHTAVAPRTLSSLLRYVDNELMQNIALHNQPPQPPPVCSICKCSWNSPVISTRSGLAASTSTFLPLSPCGHWVHYRCFIWVATMNDGRRNKCFICNTRLFEWDGINALILATRTGLELDDNTRAGSQHENFGAFKLSDRLAYEAECATIDSVIHNQFFAYLSKPSKNADSSPDLVQCFYDVLQMLSNMDKPAVRWLQYSTQTGYLLWGMLVTLKMRRYLTEGHERIQSTQGWREFEEGRRVLQGRILTEVHGP